MVNEMKLKNRIKDFRWEKGLMQEDLAELVEVSKQTISLIENLQYCPSARLAFLICIALDKKFEEVFYFE